MKDRHVSRNYHIIINGTRHRVSGAEVTFDQIADLAYPDKKRGELITYTVNYYNGGGRRADGRLVNNFNSTIKIKEGTVFNVTRTDRS